MGFELRRKLKYALACIEAVLFRFKIAGMPREPEILPISSDSHRFITCDNHSDFNNNNKNGIIREAELVMQHQFDIIGTGLKDWGNPICWNMDIKRGKKWPNHFYKRIKFKDLTGFNGSDVKIPWELSKFHHLIPLVKAYIFTKNNKYAWEAIEQISHYIDTNKIYYCVNWTCAMEIAIRACNWIWAYWVFRDDPAWTEDFNRKFLKSIWQHGWYIEHNLEDKGGIRTNHYLSNIVGLLFIGIMFPQFNDARRWKAFGIRELVSCMEEMVFPDGVSFENSTAYHRLVLELFAYSAILCQKNNIELPEPFRERLEKMFEFIMHCMRPDGRMPMIGDSDDGRFFILSNYYNWDRWDFRYILSIGAVLFDRSDFKMVARKMHEEIFWLFGEDGVKRYKQL